MFISSINISTAYNQCITKRREGAIEVMGMMGRSYLFDNSALLREYPKILIALKWLPREMRRSHGCTGLPWIFGRKDRTGLEWLMLETLDKLIALGIALELITVTHPDSATDIPYIIIEDCRQVSKERTAPMHFCASHSRIKWG